MPDYELVISETNKQGQITYGNDAFWRMTGFGRRNTIGAPHHLTWHPDMPRAIFRILSTRLDHDRGAFAYIKDITENGDHYWIFCHVIPSFGTGGKRAGYLMCRRPPSRAALKVVAPLYEKLRAIELAWPDRKAATGQSLTMLDAILKERGQSYEQFIFSRATEA